MDDLLDNATFRNGIREDGTVEGYAIETHYLPCIGIEDDGAGFLRVLIDDNATDVETRVPHSALIAAGWVKAPAGVDACHVEQLSSRMCECGTKGCIVVHGVQEVPVAEKVALKVKLPYTEAIRKADTDGEFTYSTDQDFSDPEKYGWERVYGVDQMIEYGNACARAALVALGRNAGVRMSVLRGKACTCGALGTGSAAGRTTAEFSSLRTQAHGYGVPGTHEGEQHG
jgi:hypothetical protein